MKTVTIYTDGSVVPNPGPGGWAAILIHTKPNGQVYEEIISGHAPCTTNVRMELTAVIKALAALKQGCDVHIYTDTQYVEQCLTELLPKWKRHGWRNNQGNGVKNARLWQSLHAETLRHYITWYWVKAHSGDKNNERVDQLANAARMAQFKK